MSFPNFTRGKRAALLLGLVSCALASTAQAADRASVARAIKADVAELIGGINAHDPVKATLHDAPDVISMEAGRPSSVGIQADREGLKFAFAANPAWRVSLIGETVDVSQAGDMAVYRGTYNQDSRSHGGEPLTQKVNFIAGFRHMGDGSWKMGWYIVAPMERSHKR